MPRQDLDRLKSMCSEYGKVAPKEWPEGLIGVGPDIRRWVKAQDDAKAKPKKSEVKKDGNKQKDKSNKETKE